MRFISADDDRARIPVSIVSGFLGSGKTTLINALLSDARFARTAVAINEFGEIPIDQHLIDHGDDQTIVMANGCLCCNLAGDMESAVMRVFSRAEQGEMPSFDRLIIEPSGLSDPAPIAQSILRHPVLSRAFSLHPLVVAADAGLVVSQFGRFPEVRKQIELADTIIITKTDLVEPSVLDRTRGDLASWNARATLREAVHGEIAPELIFSPAFYDVASRGHPVADMVLNSGSQLGAGLAENDGHHHHGHGSSAHDEMSSLSLTSKTPLPWPPLEKWLRAVRIQNGERLLRMKGLVGLEGKACPVIIQAVEHVQSVPVELLQWPDDDRCSRIVLIGKGLDVAAIADSWRLFCREHVTADDVSSRNDV